MSKFIKELVTNALKERYAGVQDACVVDLTGLDVVRTQQLRRELTHKSICLRVGKNSMARRAFAAGPLAPLGDRLSGPCALATGGDSIVEVAKALAHWAKELGDIKLKEAIVEGDADLFMVEQVAKMKSRVDLLGDVAMLISSPGRALAGCLQSPAGKIAGCLKTLAERDEAA